jgi:hypothetical protein
LSETMTKKTQEEALLITIMKDEDIPKSLLMWSHELAQSRTHDLTSQAWKQKLHTELIQSGLVCSRSPTELHTQYSSVMIL